MKARIKMFETLELNYKNNLKGIEQYKRKNDKNRDLLKLYSEQILAAQELRKEHLSTLINYKSNLQEQIKLFAALKKAHNRELDYTRLMNIAEDKRNELEAKKIKKDSEWLKAGNKKSIRNN